MEVNLDGKYHKFDGHNVELRESDDYWPGWGVHDKGQANLTSPLSLDQLKAICDAKEIVAARSASDGTEERTRVNFSADDCARFQSVCRAFMLEEFGEARFQENIDKFSSADEAIKNEQLRAERNEQQAEIEREAQD